MITRATLLSLAFLTACTSAGPAPAPEPGAAATREPAPRPLEPAGSSPGPSDWALAIVGTPFVFAFRVVTCAATAAVAGPTAGLLAFTEERDEGMSYLRSGLAENCGPPYAVSVPVANSYDRAAYDPGPRPLVRYDGKLARPLPVAAAATEITED